MPGVGHPMLAADLMELLVDTTAEGVSWPQLPGETAARELEKHPSWTFFNDRLDPLACGGFVPYWPGRWTGWLFVAGEVPREYRRALIHYIKSRFDGIHGRIEAEVRADFVQGRRLLETLGFYIENPPGVLRAYGPAGEDFLAYVRFN